MNIPARIIRAPLVIALVLLFCTTALAVEKVSIDVSIDVEDSSISGTAGMEVSSGEEITLATGTLAVEQVLLNGSALEYEQLEGAVKIVPGEEGPLSVEYAGNFLEKEKRAYGGPAPVGSVIREGGVSLTGIWYPAPEGLARYELSVTLPHGYTAVSEAEEVRRTIEEDGVHYRFLFPHRVDGINLVASDRYRIVRDTFRDIDIYACFFPEDMELARTYISYTKKYLEMYEDLLGEYPYNRFSIVENFLPTGYSMPTFTLLGSSVVKLPFIVDTSLGHEIAHQWFGNSVYIDYERGNWAEGLTTYLADHLYRELEGEGWRYRKRMLINFSSYVNDENDLPLTDFRTGTDRASRAVGYSKTAMVFHMLRNLVGEEVFFASLKDLIKTKRFHRASWRDIRISFEKKYGRSLEWFFRQWMDRTGLPDLELHSPEITQSGTDYRLHFHIDQKGEPYRIKLPVTIYLKDGTSLDTLDVDGEENSFELTLRDKPVRMVLDEEYDVARTLVRDEFPPVLARLYGPDRKIIALPDEGEEVYRSIIRDFKARGASVKPAEEITLSDIEGHSIIIPGTRNPAARGLLGSVSSKEAGFYIMLKKNPWNPEKVLAVIDAASAAEAGAAVRKLPHYGKYSWLSFDKGTNKGKGVETSDKGITADLEHEVSVIEVSAIRNLNDVINGVKDKRIIYVGEVHDVFAHHAVQLDIITAIYRTGRPVAIGMEMFERSFQETLDLFTQGRIGERDFLKRSEYFQRWGFDYRLYKPILDFARTENVPVKALNLRREIIRKVSAGGIDSLSDEEKELIPGELDFSDTEYMERLEDVFLAHQGSEEKKFAHFYQSQILWDETMSRSVDEYIKANPGHTIIVLAGQGHLRFGSGIPRRTYRRNGVEYAVVLIDEEVEQGIADYVVFPKPVEGITTPKLMVFLTVKGRKLIVSGFPEKSVSEKAGLETGDILLSIDDIEIESIEDIKIHLVGKRRGDTVTLRVEREVDGAAQEMDIDVEL